jgi:hypothetical protein
MFGLCYRYIVSVSNKFITWDVSTSDLARQVHPGVEGLMMDLVISPDNRFVAAYTNNSQTILLNTLVSEFVIIDSPLETTETVQGLNIMSNVYSRALSTKVFNYQFGQKRWKKCALLQCLVRRSKSNFCIANSLFVTLHNISWVFSFAGLCLLDTNLVIYGQTTWVVFDISGKQQDKRKIFRDDPILIIVMETKDDFSIIHWSGDMNNPAMAIETYKDAKIGQVLEFHSAIVLNQMQDLCWVCPQPDCNDISMFAFRNGCWYREKDYPKNPHPLLQLALSQDESYVIGTFLTGFQLWAVSAINEAGNGCTTLKLPTGIRNIATKMNKSSSCVLSAKHTYAITGIRKELYIWSVETSQVIVDIFIALFIVLKHFVIHFFRW